MSQKNDLQTARPVVPALEELIGVRLNVLDDGFVRVIDYMGNDHSIVQAARVSYGAGTRQTHEDRGLIRYLARHGHSTPFEMCEIKLHVRVPMDTWRQWIRHRTASVNEYSTRYSVAIDAAQRTDPAEWRLQARNNRQGSEDFLDAAQGATLSRREAECQDLAREIYEERLRLGVAREQARKDLPLSTYTEAYWKTDLHNLLHFLRLRMDAHAQYEIREYALLIGHRIVKAWCPMAWEAFEDYHRDATFLSRLDRELIARAVRGDDRGGIRLARERGLLSLKDGQTIQRTRELRELEPKLEQMGLSAPWKNEALTLEILRAGACVKSFMKRGDGGR